MSPAVIWGGGAIGASLAGMLARAGHPVLLVDLDHAHVAAINRAGLAVTGRGDPFTVQPQACLPDAVQGRHETVFLCVKAHQTEAAMRDITGILSETGAVISMQNGLCEEMIARAAGPARTIGAMINVGAYRTEPGAVLIGNPGRIVVGEMDGRLTPRVEGIAAMLRQLDPAAAATGNVRGFLWGKLAYSVLIKASALDDAAVSAFLSDPRRLALQRALVREVLAVAAAEGIAVEPLDGFDPAAFAAADAAETRRSLDHMAGFFSQSAKPQSTIWQDLRILRRKTDAAAQLQPMFDIARDRGLPVPLCHHLIDRIAAIEAGSATTGPQLLDTFEDLRTGRI